MPDQIQPLISRDPATARPRALYQGGVWFFNIALLILIFSLVASGGLWAYRRSLETSKAQWTTQIQNQESGADQAQGQGGDLKKLLDELINTSHSLGIAKSLLANHVFTSNVFAFLQGATHPQVQFTAFTFSLDSRKIDLSGLAGSYRAVAEQISILESNPQVEQVNFGGLSLGDRGLVNFKLAVIVKPSLLKLGSQ